MLISSNSIRIPSILASALLLGCATTPKQGPSNADLMVDIEADGDDYEDDMITGNKYQTSKGSGDTALTPEEQESIEMLIGNVYIDDVQNCLSQEMSRFENTEIGGQFTLEITIGTDGQVSGARMIKHSVKELKPAVEGQEQRVADGFETCVVDAAKTWEFIDPTPSSVYTHTYFGAVGSQF